MEFLTAIMFFLVGFMVGIWSEIARRARQDKIDSENNDTCQCPNCGYDDVHCLCKEYYKNK